MKTTKESKVKSIVTIIAVAFILSNVAIKTQAAGLLKPINGGEKDVKIKSHKVNVTINNGFAKTEVDQIFENTGDRDLDALYSFPVPKKASLSELSLWINGNEVIGEVLEKEKAKKVHNQQKSKGKDTALAEKNDFKTFEVSVSPVRAGKETRIRLVYYQPLEIDLGVGRYLYPLADGGVDEEQIAFWSVDDEVTGSFNFNLKLKSAFPVADVRLPHYDYQASITKNIVSNENIYVGDIYNVTLNNEKEGGGARLSSDIVFYYRLAKDVPARVELIPYKADKNSDGTFMAVVTPGASLKRISEGTDWTFVLDVSGSMSGGKITTLVNGVAKVIGKMSPNDRFRIITFENSAKDISGGYVTATQENVKKYSEMVRNISTGGGTALFAGFSEAYKKLDADRTTGIILVTDGVCNIGSTKQSAFLKLIRQKDIRLFTFVIGNSANQPLLEKLAKESGGFAMNISDNDDIVGRLIQAKAKVLHQKLHAADLNIKGIKTKNITPKKIGNLYLGQQLVMFGQYTDSGEVDLTFSAKISGEEKEWKCKAYLPEIDTDNPEIERLWALSSIDEIMQDVRKNGETKDTKNQIVQLGTEYSLVTDYTSMLVIEEEEMENQGIQKNNASRVQRERKAQQQRTKQPVKNYSTNKRKGGSIFKGIKAPSIGGSGPIGIISILIIALMKHKKRASLTFVALVASTSITFGVHRPANISGCDKTFQNRVGKTDITIFPTIIRSFEWTKYDQSSSKKIGVFFETNKLAKVHYSNKKINMNKSTSIIQWNLFQTSMSLFADYLKTHSINTKYAMVVEYLVSKKPSGGEFVGGIQCYVLDSNGNNAFSFLLNSHHKLFIEAKLKSDNVTTKSRDELIKKSMETVIKTFQSQLNLDDRKKIAEHNKRTNQKSF